MDDDEAVIAALKKPLKPTDPWPLFPNDAQIGVGILPRTHAHLWVQKISYLERAQSFPKIDPVMGGRRWRDVMAWLEVHYRTSPRFRPAVNPEQIPDALPRLLFVTERQLGLRLLGGDRLEEWSLMKPYLRRRAFPYPCPVLGCTYWPAVIDYFNHNGHLDRHQIPAEIRNPKTKRWTPFSRSDERRALSEAEKKQTADVAEEMNAIASRILVRRAKAAEARRARKATQAP